MTGRHCAALALLLLTVAAPAQVPRRPGLFPNPQEPQPSIPSLLKIRVEGDHVTAEIRATPLQQVLEELAARTGVVFEVGTQENDPVSLSLYRVGLAEAIQRIVGAANSIIYYDRDVAGQNRIQYVRVLSKPKAQPPSIRYIGTGTVTKAGDDSVDTPEQALKVLAESSNLEAKQKAVEVLAATKSDVAIQALTMALEDPAPEVKAAAIEGLTALGARAALPQILSALKDAHPGVRQSAIMAVSLLGDAESVKYLRPLSRDPDGSVAAAAEMAIRKLSTRHP